jgi:hypothetical protein
LVICQGIGYVSFHILSTCYFYKSNFTKNSLMTYHFKMHGQTDKKKVKSNVIVETGNRILYIYNLVIGTQHRRQLIM